MFKKDRLVKVTHIATHPNLRMTVDKYILKLAEKQYLITQFEKALKEASVD